MLGLRAPLLIGHLTSAGKGNGTTDIRAGEGQLIPGELHGIVTGAGLSAYRDHQLSGPGGILHALAINNKGSIGPKFQTCLLSFDGTGPNSDNTAGIGIDIGIGNGLIG